VVNSGGSNIVVSIYTTNQTRTGKRNYYNGFVVKYTVVGSGYEQRKTGEWLKNIFQEIQIAQLTSHFAYCYNFLQINTDLSPCSFSLLFIVFSTVSEASIFWPN